MKKMLTIALAILMLSMPLSAFASHHAAAYGGGYGVGCGYGGTGLMRDAGGNLLSRDAFTKRLDQEIANGNIPKEYRSVYLERYDYCAQYGYGGGQGGGCWRY